MKKIISLSPKSPAVTRTVPPEVINHFIAKIESLQDSIKAVLQAEYVANLDAKAQMEMQRAKNLIEHSEEIHSRPRKEWIKSNKNKLQSLEVEEPQKKQAPGLHRMSRKKRRRLAAQAVFDAHHDGENESIPEPKEKKKKKKKSESSSEFDKETSALKMSSEVIGGTYHFRGYDPDKKLGKKKGSKKFKSRSKYK